MKLTISQPDLSALLSRVIGAVERRNTIPVLGHILLSTDDGILSASATDLDMSIQSRAEAEVITHGSTTVNATLISALVNKMAKGSLITITANDSRVTVSNGKASFDLSTLPVSDFPEVFSGDYDTELTIDGKELNRLLSKSAVAMSHDEVRYFLNGVYLHSHEGTLRAVTTDGHRLAQIDSAVDAELEGVIIPRKAVAELVKQLGSGDTTLKVSNGKISVDMGDTVVSTKTIDGTFPDYKRVIPQQGDFTVKGDAKELKQASELVSLVSGERTKAVRVSVDGDKCTLSVDTGQDKAEESVTVDSNGDCVVGFNAKYFSDAMQQCGDDEVTMNFSSGAPVIILPSDDDKALYIVMPMRR